MSAVWEGVSRLPLDPMPLIRKKETPAGPAPAEKPALESLFHEEEGHLVRFAYGFVRRREIAEELVQDAFLGLHRHWDGVQMPRAWIYRAVRNLCLSWIRDHRRESLGDETEEKADEDALPDEALGKLEAAGIVRAFLAEMAETDREILRLRYPENLQYAAIATATGLSVGNVGYRLHHLLRGLATSLKQVGVSGSAG